MASRASAVDRKVLVAEREKDSRAPLIVEPAVVWTLLAGLGLGLAVVGWTDLALLWYPLKFGSPEWEFATIGGHFDAMPLATLSTVLLAAGVLTNGWRKSARVLAVFCVLVGLVHVGVYAIYLLDVPIALGGVPPQLQPAIQKAIAKTTVFAVTYTMLYGWLGTYLWRKAR